MKIIHISYSYDFTDGGITTVIEQIIKEQKKVDLKVDWLASSQYAKPLRSEKFLKKIFDSKPSVIHLHGLWRMHTRITDNFIKNGIPYVITPHGMLDNWALKQSSLKKKLSWQLWEKKALDNCSFIQALCDSELESIKKINPLWKTYKITNGIKLPNQKELIKKYIPERWKSIIPNDAKILLFMGRFHKKKGINELIKAWSKLSGLECSKNWWLCFVGSGDIAIFKGKNFHDVQKRMIVSKPAFDDEKEEILKNSSGFILSSFSEGLPMAVLEAMSYDIPCLISESCNLTNALERGAALKTNPSTNDIYESLKLFFRMNNEEVAKMTRIAHKYISDNHSWHKLTYEIKDLYSSICKDF